MISLPACLPTSRPLLSPTALCTRPLQPTPQFEASLFPDGRSYRQPSDPAAWRAQLVAQFPGEAQVGGRGGLGAAASAS